jgi:putative membrane protein
MKFNGMKQFGRELRGIGRNRMLLVSVVGVLMIPVMYSSMFLGAFWDPYGHLDKMPIAIVNEDTGYTFEGEALHVGDDLVTELKENPKFDWQFVDRATAEAGLADHSYYMAIEIPQRFSEQTATLSSEKPEPARLTYLANESYNYLASQIGNKAVDTMKAELNKEVTSAYARTVFGQVEELAGGLHQASDGAGELASGTQKAQDGAELVRQNLAKLVSGSMTLQDGVAKLSDGGAELAKGSAGAASGASSLAGGLTQLEAAQQQLAAATTELSDGAGALGAGAAKLGDGVGQLAGAGNELAKGAVQAQQGGAQLAGGLEASAAGEQRLAAAAAELANSLAKLGQEQPELAEGEGYAALLKASRELAAGVAESAEGQQQLKTGAAAVKAGLDGVSGGLQTLSGKLDDTATAAKTLGEGGQKLAAGAGQLQSGMTQFGAKLTEAGKGADTLAAGVKQLDGGAKTLSAGLGQLAGSVSSFVDGSTQLEDGAQQVSSGLLELGDGAQELSGKLSEASDKTSDLKLTDSMVDMFADPIQLDVEKVSEVNNYGTGLAPYFLSLGLYVGAMLLTIVYSVREPAGQPVSGWSWFWSKALTLTLIGTIQALIADAALIYVLKLEVQSMSLFIGFSILTSIAFMMIIQFLVATLNNPGRFIAVILLILQLTGAAGTFPIELVPGWLQHVSPFLPMTYSIAGLRDIISSGDFSEVGTYAAILAVIAVVFGALSYLYFRLSHRKGLQQAAQAD